MIHGYKLYFASAIVCYYDAVTHTLYVEQDGIRHYKGVMPSTWALLVSNPTDTNLGYILGALTTPPVYGGRMSVEALKRRIEITRTEVVDMFLVNSSTVKAVGYDEKRQKLYVQYLSEGEPIYEFDNVTIVEWNAIQNADSKGSEIWWQISLNHNKGTYRVVTGTNLNYTGTYTTNPGTPHEEGYIVVK